MAVTLEIRKYTLENKWPKLKVREFKICYFYVLCHLKQSLVKWP